jgi:hypothetical protein
MGKRNKSIRVRMRMRKKNGKRDKEDCSSPTPPGFVITPTRAIRKYLKTTGPVWVPCASKSRNERLLKVQAAHLQVGVSPGWLMRTTPARSRSDSSAKQIESITTHTQKKIRKAEAKTRLCWHWDEVFPFSIYIHSSTPYDDVHGIVRKNDGRPSFV